MSNKYYRFYVTICLIILFGCRNSNENESILNTDSCVISFIDDDTGEYVPHIWGKIIEETGIRMGFACITGNYDTLYTTHNNYGSMSLEALRALYDSGHDIYSHSVTHAFFIFLILRIEILILNVGNH